MSETTLPAPLPAPPDSGGGAPPAPPKKRRWLPLVIVLVGVLAVGGAVTGAIVGGSDPAPATAPSVPSPGATTVVPAPTHLVASTAPFRVILRWKPGAGATADTVYVVYRDGTMVQSVLDGSTSWIDESALPNSSYRYRVDSADGSDAQDGSASVVAKTPDAPASAGRLAGVFSVKMTKTSSSGVNGIPDKRTAGWRFTPKCQADPCNVAWTNINDKAVATTLTRNGGSYEGSVQARGLLSCSGHESLSTVHVTIHATKADVVSNEWRVTAIAGTMTVYTAPQLGCTTANVSYSVSGSIAR
jgi:hypothetical protein